MRNLGDTIYLAVTEDFTALGGGEDGPETYLTLGEALTAGALDPATGAKDAITFRMTGRMAEAEARRFPGGRA